MSSRAGTSSGAGSGMEGGSRGTAMCREIQRLEINFKEPMATFKAGDILTGTVTMDIVQEIKIKGIGGLHPLYVTVAS